jgi:hypothetical protein
MEGGDAEDGVAARKDVAAFGWTGVPALAGAACGEDVLLSRGSPVDTAEGAVAALAGAALDPDVGRGAESTEDVEGCA